MKNEFIKIISSPMLQTNNVYRYSGTKMIEPESLTTHVYETQMIGYMIIHHLNSKCGESLDKGLYLEKVLHHDMEESMTGDVVRTLKYHNPSVLRELQSVAKEVAEDLYFQYFEDDKGELFDIWDNAKSGKEGFILKFVDTLTVVNRVVKEVEYFKNIYFLRVAYEVSYYLRDLKDLIQKNPYKYTQSSVDYLTEVINGAFETLDKILEKNQEVALNYKIIDKSLLKEGIV